MRTLSSKLRRSATVLSLAGAWALAAPAVAQPTEDGRCAGVRPQDAEIPGASAHVYADAGRPLKIHVLKPAGAGPAPAALFFFGGGWRQGQVSQFTGQARALQARGYVVGLADYRVACRDAATPLDSVEDAGRAYRWLLAHGDELRIDRRRVVLAGGSAGGHLALMTALRAPADARPAALVLFNPAVDLSPEPARRGLGLEEADARAVSPALFDPAPLPRMLILHGEADALVPIAQVRAFCERVTTSGGACELRAYPGQTHGFFNRRAVDPVLGASPFQATLDAMLRFVP